MRIDFLARDPVAGAGDEVELRDGSVWRKYFLSRGAFLILCLVNNVS